MLNKENNLFKGPFTYGVFCALKFAISNVDARYALIIEATRSRCDPLVFSRFFRARLSRPRHIEIKTSQIFKNAASAPQVMWQEPTNQLPHLLLYFYFYFLPFTFTFETSAEKWRSSSSLRSRDFLNFMTCQALSILTQIRGTMPRTQLVVA